jgi:hypothetical protein
MTRRDTLDIGTAAAISAAAAPLHSQTTPSGADEICFMRAIDIVGAIRAKKLSSREVVEAHLKQIAKVNPQVNAIVTLAPSPCRKNAALTGAPIT